MNNISITFCPFNDNCILNNVIVVKEMCDHDDQFFYVQLSKSIILSLNLFLHLPRKHGFRINIQCHLPNIMLITNFTFAKMDLNFAHNHDADMSHSPRAVLMHTNTVHIFALQSVYIWTFAPLDDCTLWFLLLKVKFDRVILQVLFTFQKVKSYQSNLKSLVNLFTF